MQKLIAVEEAKALMNEAQDWSVWHWLLEKRRVRATADKATEALGELEKKVKAAWGDDLRRAYRELEAKRPREKADSVDPRIKLAVQRVKDLDDEAYQARMNAEETFDQAEKQLSTEMAREGAQKAIESWELREKAIRKAEALTHRK
jgi:hypothetical protein